MVRTKKNLETILKSTGYLTALTVNLKMQIRPLSVNFMLHTYRILYVGMLLLYYIFYKTNSTFYYEEQVFNRMSNLKF